MELDALKKTLNSLSEQSSSKLFSRDVSKTIELPSSGYITRMKRNLLLDFCLIIAGQIYLILFYTVKYKGDLWLCALFFAVELIAVSVYFIRKRKLLNDMQGAGLNTTHFLEKQITVLKKYISWYIIWGTLFLPVTIVLVFIMANLYQPALLENKDTVLYWISSDANRWASFAGLLTLTVVAYHFSKWYVFKLYGRHIEMLFSLLKEMNEK